MIRVEDAERKFFEEVRTARCWMAIRHHHEYPETPGWIDIILWANDEIERLRAAKLPAPAKEEG